MNGSHRQAPDSNCQFPRAGKGLSAHQLSDVAGFLNKKADGKHRWITHLSRNKQTRKHRSRNSKVLSGQFSHRYHRGPITVRPAEDGKESGAP